MTKDIMLFVLFLAVLLLCAWPLGKYMARVFNYEKTCGERFFAPLENIFYKMAKVDPRTEMPWKEYCLNLIIFNALGMLSLFVLQLTQAFYRSIRSSCPTSKPGILLLIRLPAL